MFPDVFQGSAISKQNLQMASFYDTTHDKPRIQPRLQLPTTQPHQQPAHVVRIPGVQSAVINTCKDPADLNEINNDDTIAHPTCNTRNSFTSLYTTRPPLLPPMRKIVKFSIAPFTATLLVVICMLLNIVTGYFVWFAAPESVTPDIITHWMAFLHIWPLVTIIQLVSHSVYICTPVTSWLSVLHLVVISTTAAIPIHLLPLIWFLRILLFISITIAAYQSTIFCLVHSYLRHKWVYVTFTGIFVVFPVLQLGDYTETDTVNSSSWWSTISICSIYTIALINARGGLVVDVSVAPSPTWSQE
jgi:hypothetical protein